MKKEELSYLEFRKACFRNLEICQILLNSYEICNKENERQSILHKVYYLGGYVIEFAIKFSLFSHLKSKINVSNVYEWENKDWKDHNFQKLKNIATSHNLSYSQDIPFLGNTSNLSKETLNLIQNWDVQIRYSLTLNKTNKSIKLNFKELLDYFKCIEKITNQITTKYN